MINEKVLEESAKSLQNYLNTHVGTNPPLYIMVYYHFETKSLIGSVQLPYDAELPVNLITKISSLFDENAILDFNARQIHFKLYMPQMAEMLING